jgi:YidC/Oxa1 family membrane protein insertase
MYMKFKDFLVPLAFAVVFTWFIQTLIQYFAPPKAQQSQEVVAEAKPGRSFVAPKREQLNKPLMTEVDFLDADVACTGESLAVTSQRMEATFATCGAAVARMVDTSIIGVSFKDIVTLDVPQPQDRERSAFLLALDAKTPLTYSVVNKSDENGVHLLTFRSATKECVIEKTFKFYDDSFKVDLSVMIEPLTADGVRPRLFLPSPTLVPNTAADVVQAIALSDTDVVERKKADMVEGWLWEMSSLFGTENRYFINALVADGDHFVQRAYYKVQGAKNLIAILEGPLVQKTTTWNMSFYCGPKQNKEIALVDPRLEVTLDYGWFGFIAKLALALLTFLFGIVRNYGIAIILLTILMRLVMLPFTFKAEQSMKKSQELKKKLQYLEQKYKDDPQTLAMEKSEAIRKHGVSDMLGCLPILLQIPVIMGLSRALSTSLELYHAPFFGWIHDLSAVDPYYILPLVAGLGLLFGQAGAVASDPRQRFMTMMIALVSIAIFVNIAAGVVLFIATSAWLGFAQTAVQKMIKRHSQQS